MTNAATYTHVDPYDMGTGIPHELVSIRDAISGTLVEWFIRKARP